MEAYKIKVLVKSFPSYTPILAWYNANKPTDWQPLREAGIDEGGFEVRLTSAELEQMRQRRYGSLDPNECVRQMEWHRGELRPHHDYPSLREEEKKLLGEALQMVLGAEKVEITQLKYDV